MAHGAGRHPVLIKAIQVNEKTDSMTQLPAYYVMAHVVGLACTGASSMQMLHTIILACHGMLGLLPATLATIYP